MKTLLITTALIISATTASAFTCKNTVTSDVHGVVTYSASQCGNQAPASADQLAMMTHIANNPPKDNVVEDEVAVVIEVPLTKLEKLNTRLATLMSKKSDLQDKIKAATGQKKKNLKDKRKKLNKRINKVNNRINKVNGTKTPNTKTPS